MRRLEMMPFGVFRLSTAMAAGREFELLLILALVSVCIGADPCKDYDRLWMEYGRRSSDFNSEDTATSICDAFLDQNRWYRIEHDAGNRLIEKPVEPWYCGTQVPVWLNGTHPTDTTEVTAEVCGTYSSINVCGWKGTVRIQMCNESGSEYFVYQLAVPLGCPVAYCVDAASRKQCIPPLMWLHDEFKCGEHIKTSTAAPTRTSTSRSPTETPCSGGPGFGPWGPWSECSKTCDHGLQTRKRTCCQPPCTGAAISHRPCAESNCKELQEEKDKGIVLSLQSATHDTMFKVVENQKKIDTILRGNINSICSQNASLCCGVKTESTSADSNEFVISDDIYAAKGFPKQKSDGTVDYKTIAIVNEAVNQATCSSDSKRLRARQAPSTNPNFVPFEVMEMAAESSSPYILRETGLVVKECLDPVTYPDDSEDDGPCPVTTCIVPIVVCCAVIPVIAIIVGCITLQMMKKSTPKSTYGKDPHMAAPNMVYPYVNAGETKSGSLPGKPS